MFLLIVSLIAGALTVLAPCILPLLPVVVGRSLEDGTLNWARTVRVLGSLGVSIFIFTFLLKISTLFISVPLSFWTLLSGIILILTGIFYVFPSLFGGKNIARIGTSAQKTVGSHALAPTRVGDIIIGMCLGPIFSTCSPTYLLIVATVLPVNIATGIIYLLAYILGLLLALSAVAILGEWITSRMSTVSDSHGLFNRLLGLLFITIGALIIFGGDKAIERSILDSGFFDVTKIEQKLLK